MSRLGQKPIEIPEGVKIFVKKGQVTVEGHQGKISQRIRPEIEVLHEGKQIKVNRKSGSKLAKALHGTIRTLINNMIIGVTSGFEKKLKLVGTGYRVKKEGENLVLSIGFSHPVIVKPNEGIKFEIVGNDEIIISGVNKGLVSQTAANIRKIKKPDAYKGKGIRYQNEVVKLKPGKAAKVGAEGVAAEGE